MTPFNSFSSSTVCHKWHHDFCHWQFLGASPHFSYSLKNGSCLHLANLGIGDGQSAATMAKHGVGLLQLCSTSSHAIQRYTCSFGHQCHFCLRVGDEFMQRWIQQTDRHWIAIHDSEQFRDVLPLHDQQLVQGLSSISLISGQDHLPHGYNSLSFEEHVLSADKANALGTEFLGLSSISRGSRHWLGPQIIWCITETCWNDEANQHINQHQGHVMVTRNLQTCLWNSKCIRMSGSFCWAHDFHVTDFISPLHDGSEGSGKLWWHLKCGGKLERTELKLKQKIGFHWTTLNILEHPWTSLNILEHPWASLTFNKHKSEIVRHMPPKHCWNLSHHHLSFASIDGEGSVLQSQSQIPQWAWPPA